MTWETRSLPSPTPCGSLCSRAVAAGVPRVRAAAPPLPGGLPLPCGDECLLSLPGQLVEFLKKSETKGPLSCDAILKIFYQTCRAVQHMHRQKPPIIHRDLKVPPPPRTPRRARRGGPASAREAARLCRVSETTQEPLPSEWLSRGSSVEAVREPCGAWAPLCPQPWAAALVLPWRRGVCLLWTCPRGPGRPAAWLVSAPAFHAGLLSCCSCRRC